MENYQLNQGAALTIDVTLRDSDGQAVTAYDGTQPLSCTVWPGGARAASFSPTAAWTRPEAGTLTIAIAAAQTSGLEPGRYRLLLRLDDAGTTVDAYECSLDIAAQPGTGPEPKSYGDYNDLLKYGRSWLRQLATDDDEAGFAEQRARARTWIEDLAHAHYRVASMAMVVGNQALGPRRSGARSQWLQDQLDADKLMVTDQVREAAAKKALAYVCEGQVGPTEASAAYARLARMYHGQADYLATCLTLSLDTDGDGFPDVNIDLSCTDPMYG